MTPPTAQSADDDRSALLIDRWLAGEATLRERLELVILVVKDRSLRQFFLILLAWQRAEIAAANRRPRP